MPAKPNVALAASKLEPTTDLEPIAVPPREARRLLGISNNHLYNLFKSGEIDSFYSGRARRIPVASLHRYVARQLAVSTGKRPPGRPRARRNKPKVPTPTFTAAEVEA